MNRIVASDPFHIAFATVLLVLGTRETLLLRKLPEVHRYAPTFFSHCPSPDCILPHTFLLHWSG